MQRIVIIGCPAAGKSTLARKLSQKLNIPITHLDSYGHTKEFHAIDNKIAFHKKIASLSDKDNHWISEGNYCSTFESRIPPSDTVLFLDYSQPLILYRLLKRRIEFHSKVRPEMPNGWKEKLNWEFFKFVWRFRRNQRPKILEELKKYPTKNIRAFKNPKQTQKFLDSL